jgi:hypothetical protein
MDEAPGCIAQYAEAVDLKVIYDEKYNRPAIFKILLSARASGVLSAIK